MLNTSFETSTLAPLAATPLTFQGLLFGYCPVARQLQQYLLTPQIQPTLEVKISDPKVEAGSVLAIGSGAAEMGRQLQQAMALGKPRPVFAVFQEIVAGGSVATVGGYPQL